MVRQEGREELSPLVSLFRTSNTARLLDHFLANPHRRYTILDLVEYTGLSEKTIRVELYILSLYQLVDVVEVRRVKRFYQLHDGIVADRLKSLSESITLIRKL